MCVILMHRINTPWTSPVCFANCFDINHLNDVFLGAFMSNFNNSTAVVSWGNVSLRVYSSDGQNVTEKCWDGGGPWYVGAMKAVGQSVGAASWLDTGGQIHIRVYVSNQGKIVEYCWDKDTWYVGALSTDGTHSSATAWYVNGAVHLRVYVTKVTGQVQEECWDGGGPWYVGAYTG
jgi:Fungal fucose-specific lectin